MRGADVTQAAMFSYRTLEERIPREHSLRKVRTLVDGILVTLHAQFEAMYADSGRPSIPPERLLRASLIQTLYTIRSERQLVQHIEYNLLTVGSLGWTWMIRCGITPASPRTGSGC